MVPRARTGGRRGEYGQATHASAEPPQTGASTRSPTDAPRRVQQQLLRRGQHREAIPHKPPLVARGGR